MSLKLMYITNNTEVTKIAQKAGVDRIFVDMEYIGKEERQKGMNTVKSNHTVEDVKRLRPVLSKSELLVRVNPIHNETDKWGSTEEEIDEIVNGGADIIMLPMFKTADDVKRFVNAVGRRTKTMLLLETREAVDNLDEILEVDGIDEIHIGLNDLHLAYGLDFMFELLANGLVDKLCSKISTKIKQYGFGGIARIGYGVLPAEYIIKEHYRLGSKCAILSRSFCNADKIDDIKQIEKVFGTEIENIRKTEEIVSKMTQQELLSNHEKVKQLVNEIVNQTENKNE